MMMMMVRVMVMVMGGDRLESSPLNYGYRYYLQYPGEGEGGGFCLCQIRQGRVPYSSAVRCIESCLLLFFVSPSVRCSPLLTFLLPYLHLPYLCSSTVLVLVNSTLRAHLVSILLRGSSLACSAVLCL